MAELMIFGRSEDRSENHEYHPSFDIRPVTSDI
jgi:hypothetical protein